MEAFKTEQQNNKERIDDTTLIKDIQVIPEGGVVALTRENLSKLVEAPLLEACEDLYDKNVETIMSSANASNVGKEGYISIVFDSLSDENKKVALELGTLFNMHGSKNVQCVNLMFPISETATVGEIKNDALALTAKFGKQPMVWAKRLTLGDYADMYGVPVKDLTPESFPDKFYDPESGFLYDSEEHYKKVKDFK